MNHIHTWNAFDKLNRLVCSNCGKVKRFFGDEKEDGIL